MCALENILKQNLALGIEARPCAFSSGTLSYFPIPLLFLITPCKVQLGILKFNLYVLVFLTLLGSHHVLSQSSAVMKISLNVLHLSLTDFELISAAHSLANTNHCIDLTLL